MPGRCPGRRHNFLWQTSTPVKDTGCIGSLQFVFCTAALENKRTSFRAVEARKTGRWLSLRPCIYPRSSAFARNSHSVSQEVCGKSIHSSQSLSGQRRLTSLRPCQNRALVGSRARSTAMKPVIRTSSLCCGAGLLPCVPGDAELARL